MSRPEVCSACGHANPPESRFCGQCGNRLAVEISCGECGAANPAGQRFCNQCGSALAEQGRPERGADAAGAAAAEPEAAPAGPGAAGLPTTPEHLAAKIRASRSSLEGERKQVTVLFCDVVGSMELAERTNPETWRRAMQGLFATLCEGVHRFEGTVDKFTGDGMMALFGAPIAHEDHAQRACYAALYLRERLAGYAAELRRTEGLNLSVRMGLNSGEVVVGAIGDDLGMDYTALGHTVGLAQRMESLAEAGKAFMTRDTAALVGGYLALEDLGEFRIKGASEPVRVYELTGPGSARGRLDVSRARGLSRFVGREEEMRALEQALEHAHAGEGGVIGIVGEAGVGKSRLCHEFAERCRARGITVYHAAGQAHTRSVPLAPVLELMRTYFDLADGDSPQTARERIAGKLLLLDESFAADLPLVFDFLAVPDRDRPAPRMDPEARRRELLGLVRRLVRSQGAREPALTLFEDLHWVDPATEPFLAQYVEAVSGVRSLAVVNFRPDYHAEWMSRPYYRQIPLLPFGPGETEQMLAGLLGSHASLDGLSETIQARAAGNPFFIEEVVQSLVEAGSLSGAPGAYELVRPVDEAAVPASVQAVLAARIDRLSDEDKAVLQAAAVIGKEFSEPVLADVADRDPEAVDASLRNLVAGEFVHEQELYPETVYAFKHPLTQEVAYGSQLAGRRAGTHARVATAIAERHPDRVDERAALIAGHWEAAGEPLEAARWHARAAAWSGTQDPVEAIGHWRRVRELADSLPASEETTALGLTARIYALQFGWRLGIGHDEAEAIFNEAERIAAKTGDVRSRAILLSVYGGIRGVTDGELDDFAALARRALALAEEAGDPHLYLTVVLAAYAFFAVGEFEECLAAVERAIELTDGDPAVGAGIALECPLAYCLGLKGITLASLGRIGEAREVNADAQRVARAQGDLETAVWAHGWQAWTEHLAGDYDAQAAHAQQGFEIAQRIGDSFSRAWAWQWLGYAQAMRGELDAAIESLERSRSLSRERRTAVEAEGYTLARLGHAYALHGDPERGRRLIAEGIEVARARGHRTAEAMAYSVLAEVLLAAGDDVDAAEVEAAIARGLELARAVGWRSLEPLFAVSAAELAGRRGDRDARRRGLEDAHRQFVAVGATAHAERLAGELAAA
ncbi:MAG TPA: adenylate/guanylate cyclase domain-containing protein [Solirubrobacterales bacterium]|nr:adenylate/guanylate cyclase domain-containing protein [Solirubrobacterales bacterium]